MTSADPFLGWVYFKEGKSLRVKLKEKRKKKKGILALHPFSEGELIVFISLLPENLQSRFN